jgi:futalosine hydrolase
MYVLVTSPTQTEIMPFRERMGEASRPDLELHVTITGVGLVATAHALMHEVCRRRPDLVIQAGIAGSFHPELTGKTFCIKDESFGDLGVFEGGQFKSLFELDLAGRNDFPFTDGRLVNPHGKLLSLTRMPPVRSVSVHTITTDMETAARYQQKEKAVVESMEGASLHYVCLMEHIPFVQLRSVSNQVGQRDKSQWKIKDAILHLNETLFSFIHQLE